MGPTPYDLSGADAKLLVTPKRGGIAWQTVEYAWPPDHWTAQLYGLRPMLVGFVKFHGTKPLAGSIVGRFSLS